MRLVRPAVGWTLTVPVLAGVLFAPTAALGTSEQPQARDAARLIVHGVGTGVTYGGYRTSLQPPRATAGPIATPQTAGRTVSASPSSSTPTSVQGFLGIPQIEGFEPADPTGAMGQSFFLTAVNTRFALWNLDGTEAIPPTLLGTLTSQDNGLDIFDPKIVYDQYRDTFVMAYLAQRDSPPSSEIVVTSIPDATADQPSTWCTRAFPGDQIQSDAPQWADYPGLGYNRERVVITTNQFTFPTRNARFSYAQVASIPKSRLYDCTAQLAGDVFAGTETSNEDGSPAFTIQPAQTVGTAADDQFMVSIGRRRGRRSLTLWRLRETARGPRLKRTTIKAGRTGGRVVGTQAGGSLTNPDTFWDTGDVRLVTAWYDADRNQLYAAHNVARDLVPDTVTGDYVESAIRWYEVDPAGTLSSSTLARKGTIGDPETDAGWPSVATDAAGNLFVTYSRGSLPLGEFISAWAAEIPPGSTTATVTELVAGTAFHDSIPGIERWGDFTAIGRDPLDPTTIVMVNQIATPGSAWQQTVNLVTHA